MKKEKRQKFFFVN